MKLPICRGGGWGVDKLKLVLWNVVFNPKTREERKKTTKTINLLSFSQQQKICETKNLQGGVFSFGCWFIPSGRKCFLPANYKYIKAQDRLQPVS